MITIITNGQKKKAPTCWREVTVEQAQRIAKEWDCVDKITLFNILTGTEYQRVRESTDIGGTFWDVIQFAYFPSEVKNAKLPRVIKLNGKLIGIPQKVGRLTIGQSIAVRQKMEEVQMRIEKAIKENPGFKKYTFTDGFYFDEIIAFTCAVYLQPLYDLSPFDDERAAQLEKDILRMSITDVYPIGFFLLSQQLSFGKKSIWGLLLKIAQRIHNVNKYRS